jgi:hypothetical protein
MIVYGHRSFRLDARNFLKQFLLRLDQLPATPSRDALMDLLVDVGEAEAAVDDAFLADEDDEARELDSWRDLAHAVASAFCANSRGEHDTLALALEGARRAARHALEHSVAPTVHAKTSEGFACYALYPDQYIDAAEQILAFYRPRRVFCLGLRSIGSILAHIVAATVERSGVSTAVRSARPRGQPFDRRLRLGDDLQRLIRESASDIYAVIDEGPGLSGSSFAAAADALVRLGIPIDRIVLVPSWNADCDRLNSARGRAIWQSHRRFVGSFDTAFGDLQDLSAGRWRSRVRVQPAVQPQHERRKYLDVGSGTMWKFAGLGKYGQRKLERATLLASAGFCATARGLANGYLAVEWVDGDALKGSPAAGLPPLIDRTAEYLAFLKCHFRTGAIDDIDELAAMLATNAGEAGIPIDIDLISAATRRNAGERIAIDGRMLPHEWVESPGRIVKTDSLDHHDDDFFPGSRDIAWDLAGVIAEFELNRGAASALVEKYQRLSADLTIAARLPFYEAAYLAYRLGYSKLAAGTVADAEEALRFDTLYRKYTDQLTRLHTSLISSAKGKEGTYASR